MTSSFIIAARRTPIGRFLGGLSDVPAPQLAARAISAAVSDAQVDVGTVDEVIIGNVLSAGVGQAPARQAALQAGIPDTVAAVTVNKVCGSGLKAVMLADQAVRAGDAALVVAGGMESMSRAPHLLANRRGWKFGDQQAVDSMLHDGLWCATEDVVMGELAEATAAAHGINRAAQDNFAAESHQRAAGAQESGALRGEIVPVTLEGRTAPTTIDTDEGPRPDTTTQSLAKLRPAFREDGTVTAGNASQISDGAAAVIVASEQFAQATSPPIKARIVASATSGGPPKDLFVAPVAAIEKVLAKARMTLSDVDLIELNEAFASQCLACIQRLDLDQDKLNVHGGAIALGHPIGASGARVLVTLLHALSSRGESVGLASLCLGGGNAVAMIVELV